MSESVNIGMELAKLDAAPSAIFPGAYIFYDRTPAHRFTTIVAPVLEGKCFVALCARDYFDEGLAGAILRFVNARSTVLSPETPLMLLDSFDCAPYRFEMIAVLSPGAAQQLKSRSELLNSRTFLVFPIYRCELSGDETTEVVDTIRHEVLNSLDWKRSPCPKVTMAYKNSKNRTGSPPRMTKLATVLFEIKELHEAEGSWIEIENYAGRRCRVMWSHGDFFVECPNQSRSPVDHAVLVDLLQKFITYNQ